MENYSITCTGDIKDSKIVGIEYTEIFVLILQSPSVRLSVSLNAIFLETLPIKP